MELNVKLEMSQHLTFDFWLSIHSNDYYIYRLIYGFTGPGSLAIENLWFWVKTAQAPSDFANSLSLACDFSRQIKSSASKLSNNLRALSKNKRY